MAFGISQAKQPVRCGVIVDIGSGSVGISIIISDEKTPLPEVVWSHREHGLIKNTESVQDSLKEIKTTLIRAFLELGNAGTKTLRNHPSGLKITFMQTAISAPWSYTVTKSIRFKNEHPFVVTEKLIAQLVTSAKKHAQEKITENQIIENLGLQTINGGVTKVSLNGYSLQKPIGQTGRSVSLSYLHTVASGEILKTLKESAEKIIPDVHKAQFSFLSIFYSVLENLSLDASEICLVDVTNEATELGIVRDGAIKYVTHINFGTYTISREIAALCDITKEEAYTYMKEGGASLDIQLPKNKTEEIEVIIDAYSEKIADAFTQTGDVLSVPKSIFLHTDQETEAFFTTRLKKGAKLVTGSNHTVHKFTSRLIGEENISDSALTLSQQYFHKKMSCFSYSEAMK